MELAIQLTSNDRTVKSDRVHDLKNSNKQCLATQAKKEEQVVSLVPSFEKAFDLLHDDKVELYTENETLKTRIGSHD